MQSTFFGLTIAGSGLSTYQTAINTTANNVANVKTDGYSRQQVIMEAARALRCNQKYGTLGAGVEATAIEQIRNVYYDMKYWNASASLGEYTTKQDYLGQIENYFLDTEQVEGFSTIFSNMYTNLETLNTQSSQFSARQSFVSSAQSLSTYFKAMSQNLSSLQTEINQVIYTNVDKINTIATKIAAVNKEITIVEQKGGEASELRDKRALLVDELADIVPVETKEEILADANGAKSYCVTICGHVLVDAYEKNQLACVERAEKLNQSDAEGLYDIYWVERNGVQTNVKLEPNSNLMSGQLKGLFAVRDGNNAKNFQGTIDSFFDGKNFDGEDVTVVKIKDPQLTELSEIIMNSKGTIVLDNKEVEYKGFELYQDDNGDYFYHIYLAKDDGLTDAQKGLYLGQKAEIGTAIEYMGIPYYQSQLNGFLRNFCMQYNEIEKTGYDFYGNKGENFFMAHDDANGGQYQLNVDRTPAADGSISILRTDDMTSYYLLQASNFEVNDKAVENPYTVATADSNNGDGADVENAGLIKSLYELCTQTKVFRNIASDSFLQCIMSDIAVDTQESKIFVTNFSNLQNTITSQRMSVSGVDEDEEALNLVKFQNAYSLSSKVVQVLSEVYDRLILETGV